ncbi:Zinc finger protein [Plecturocebus cupreus]
MKEALMLEHSGMITPHCSLNLPASGRPPTPVPQVAETTGVCHKPWVIFEYSVEMGLSLCFPGWSQTSGLKQSSCFDFPKCWDCGHEPLCPARLL